MSEKIHRVGTTVYVLGERHTNKLSAFVARDSREASEEDALSLARKFEASDEMLEALTELVDAYFSSSDPILAINKARAAIAKARGEK